MYVQWKFLQDLGNCWAALNGKGLENVSMSIAALLGEKLKSCCSCWVLLYCWVLSSWDNRVYYFSRSRAFAKVSKPLLLQQKLSSFCFIFSLVKIDDVFLFLNSLWMPMTLKSHNFLSATLRTYFCQSLEIILCVIVISCIVGKLLLNIACCMAVIYGDCNNSWLDTDCGYQWEIARVLFHWAAFDHFPATLIFNWCQRSTRFLRHEIMLQPWHSD